MPALPSSVRIREVGPRDGFQNEPETISTADKVRLIDLLSATGLKRVEVTSFVRPDVIPQLSDAEEVLTAVQRRDRVAFSVLIPNERGLERALGLRERFDEISVFLSASETHNQRNVNRSIEESLGGLERTLEMARSAGLRCEGVIATSFGCPYEGEVPPERVFEIAERLAVAGCVEVGFGDTTGMANPRQVREFFATARDRLVGGGENRASEGGEDRHPGGGESAAGVELTAHFHNTRGQGLANVLAALEEGIESFESSFGELGGCPVPPGSTGNVSTEDVVSMLHEMGVETGIDLPLLVDASRAAQDVLGRPLGAHVLRAGPVDWHPAESE
jgi:hydroxymethylglutaryl-CoA lyase